MSKKIPLSKFNEFLKEAMNEETELRVGQSFYSKLHDYDKRMATVIVGSECDMFYFDENLYNFMTKYVSK